MNVKLSEGDKKNTDIEEEMDALREIFFDLELSGVKSFFLFEKDGEISIFDNRLSGKAIVKLILYMADNYGVFFEVALEIIKKVKEEIDEKEKSVVH